MEYNQAMDAQEKGRAGYEQPKGKQIVQNRGAVFKRSGRGMSHQFIPPCM